MTPEIALDMIIQDFALKEIELIKRAEKKERQNIDAMKKMYFYAGEFAEVQIPKETRDTILKRVKTWIKERKKANTKEDTKEEKDNSREI